MPHITEQESGFNVLYPDCNSVESNWKGKLIALCGKYNACILRDRRLNAINSLRRGSKQGIHNTSELASNLHFSVNIPLRADVGTAKIVGPMGPLMKKEIELSCKMTKKVLPDLESHNCSTYSFSPEKCKQSNGMLQGSVPSNDQSFKTSQVFFAEGQMQLPSSESKLDQKARTDPCKDGFFALGAPFETSDKILKNVEPFSVSSKSKTSGTKRNACVKSMAISEADSLSQKHEIEPALLESLREQELPFSNLGVNDPFSMDNVSQKNSLLHFLGYFPQKAPSFCSRKKLLVLDINVYWQI